MRITTLLIGIQACFATVLLAGTISAQTINLDVKEANVKQIFITIEKQTNVTFVYNDQTLQGLPNISIKATNKSLEDILKNLSLKVPLHFKQSGTVIGVSRTFAKPAVKEAAPKIDAVIPPLPAPIRITGKILNAKGVPLLGVTVTVEETKKVSVTDANGVYSIDADTKQTLLFSYVGYKKQEIPISGKDHIDVFMEEDLSPLDEIHIIAYGTTTERLSTGSISKITADEIEQQPVENPLAAMEGKVPGSIITQSNGVPGSAFKVQLQGQNSLASGASALTTNSSPLFIIDGIPFAPNNNSINILSSAAGNLSPFNSINTADIESIEVLKDADATAIYGSRGAYGVILITTKKGKAGKTSVNAAVNSGISGITRAYDELNTQQYLAMRHEAFKNDGIAPTVSNAPDLLLFDTTKYTNWKKELIGNTAHMTDAETSISGGNENTQFLISGGYHHETTVLPGNEGDSRASFHMSLDHTTTDKKFHISLSASYSSDNNNILVSDLTNLINLPPDYPALFDGSGNPVWQYKGTALPLGNPLTYLLDTYQATTNNLIGNLQLSYILLPGLTLKASLGYNSIRINEVTTYPNSSEDPQYGPNQGAASFAYNSFDSYIAEPQIEYKKTIYGGKLDILGGGSFQQIINNNQELDGYGYSSDNLLQSISAAGAIDATNQYSKYRYQAFFSRVNYNWDDKYILNLTGRRDGSSRFGPGRQFANFGAVGGAWLFTKEKFIRDNLSFLSFGKLRASYGITGSDQIGDYQYLDSWTTTTYPYQGTPGLKPTRLDNPDYSWEVNKKISAGIDLGFLNDRLLFSADYYRNRSDNHLLNVAVPSQTGFTSILENFPALVQNRGFEGVISTKNIDGKDFTWTTSLNLTLPQNKLLSFDNISTSSYSSYIIGQSLSNIKGYQFLGVNPATGIFQYGTSGQVGRGNLDPKFYGGFTNSFNYKSLSLSVFFEFRKQSGLNYLPSIYSGVTQPGSMINEPVTVLNHWQNSGDLSGIEKYTATSGTPAQLAAAQFGNGNTGWVSDASFIRLKNLSLTYNLPASWINRLHIAKVNLFVRGQNLLTFTHYLGNDPETQSYNTLPPLKTLTAGLQLTL